MRSFETIRYRLARNLGVPVAAILASAGCAAVANDTNDAENTLYDLGYREVVVTDEDAVLAGEYCGESYGTSFEFYGERIGDENIRTFGRLCIPEVGEFFKKPYVIVESRSYNGEDD